jgi:hypothetical protein
MLVIRLYPQFIKFGWDKLQFQYDFLIEVSEKMNKVEGSSCT